MQEAAGILNPATPVGSFIINFLATVGASALGACILYLAGPLRWWTAGRALKQILLSGRSFVFVFNPTHEQCKPMTFLPNGEIGEGKNSNEHSWRIRRGKLEILAFDKEIYSRFVQDKKTGRLEHTNDPDTRSIHGQYFLPHFTPWRSVVEQVALSGGESASQSPDR